MAFSRRQFLSRVRILTQSFPNRALATPAQAAATALDFESASLISEAGRGRLNK